jgi:hypothetical protein
MYGKLIYIYCIQCIPLSSKVKQLLKKYGIVGHDKMSSTFTIQAMKIRIHKIYFYSVTAVCFLIRDHGTIPIMWRRDSKNPLAITTSLPPNLI